MSPEYYWDKRGEKILQPDCKASYKDDRIFF